jgi:tetratricopeptide (TPR) repeat protein
MNECEKAIDYYNKSLEVKSKVSATEGGVPDRHGQGLTYMEMGLLYEEQREEEKATNYFQLALDYLNNYSPEFKQISKRIQKT